MCSTTPAFVLAPGQYHLKFIVRENQTGRMGSFETDVTIPDLRKAPLRMSSVVLANQRVPASGRGNKKGLHPLVQNQTGARAKHHARFYAATNIYICSTKSTTRRISAKKAASTAGAGNSALDALLGAVRLAQTVEQTLHRNRSRERRRPRLNQHRIPARQRESLRIETNRRQRSHMRPTAKPSSSRSTCLCKL